MWQIGEKLFHDFELGLICKKHMAWNSLGGAVVISNPLHLGIVSTKSQTQLVLDSFAVVFCFFCFLLQFLKAFDCFFVVLELFMMADTSKLSSLKMLAIHRGLLL